MAMVLSINTKAPAHSAPKTRAAKPAPRAVRPRRGAKSNSASPTFVKPATPAAGAVAPLRLVPATPAERPDRGSYDGDTAIKLYLREIGQVRC